ncbi:MAG: RecX family transcriptional regulator [Gemmatimonadales bacterium]|nr:MAG: RecX family transcriptional regulator [Gemmatimonadales bacterium]
MTLADRPEAGGSLEAGRHITRIESSPRPSGARAVFVDGVLFCVVPGETVARLDLEVGARVSPQTLRELEATASQAGALEAAFRLLAYRARSRIELERRLRRSGYPAPAVDAAVVRCMELGYLDDRSFALAYVRDRLKLRPRGRRVLAAELCRKGVEQEDAAAAIEMAFAEADLGEAELAHQLAQKRVHSLAGLAQPVARRRLTAYLARRGFPPAIIREAVLQAIADSPGD